MKTILLSPDDIQNFSKLIFDPKALQLTNTADIIGGIAGAGISGIDNNSNLMALQYYLNKQKQPPTTVASPTVLTPAAQQHHFTYVSQQLPQQTLNVQQQQQHRQQHKLTHTQLKQPSMQHHSNYHHPYYNQQQQQPQTQPVTAYNAVTLPQSYATTTRQPSLVYTQSTHNYNQQTHTPSVLPIHALNQNSNFSAASSSTGGGTASSHAPTQQSNTTNSSLSPPARTTAPPRPANGKGSAAATTANSSGTRSNSVGSAKKLKIEPLLSQFQQTERLAFAETHTTWGEEQWKRVVFQDERKFNLDGPDGFSYYFHDLRNYERSLSQRPRGNSVFIYIVITAGGPVHLDISVAKQRVETCVETILRERPNIIAKLGGNSDFLLQDQNWTTNCVPTTIDWLQAEGIKTQKWPSIAHDVNIMENIWGWLIREVFDGGRKFSRKDDLIFRIREAWSRLPMDLINNLYSTMPERITELYYTRGIYTNC